MRPEKSVHLSRITLLVLWFYCALLCGLAEASLIGISADVIGLPIDQFRVSGNLKTQEKYILKWSELEIGQTLTLSAVDICEWHQLSCLASVFSVLLSSILNALAPPSPSAVTAFPRAIVSAAHARTVPG